MQNNKLCTCNTLLVHFFAVAEAPSPRFRGGEDFGLNEVKFRRSPPLNVTSLKWSPLIIFDYFRNPPPPPCLYFLSKFEWSPLWILRKFSAISPFGFSVTTDAPVCSSKNQVIPPIMTGPLAGKNGHRKRIFSKTLSRVEIFENGGFSFSNTMMSFIKNTSSHDACSIRYAIVFPSF